MRSDLSVRCSCGAFEGVAHDVSPGAGNHVICYCDDCQSFQHFLGQADRVLDADGGTHVFQMSSGRFEITKGREHLAAMRLSPGGVVRWYADCCNSPIGNTLATPKLPFVSLVTVAFAQPTDGTSTAAVLGPVRAAVYGRFATGSSRPSGASDRVPLSIVFRFIVRLIGWRLRGDAKRSPFFDAATGEPAVAPKVLSKTERAELREQMSAFDAAAQPPAAAGR